MNNRFDPNSNKGAVDKLGKLGKSKQITGGGSKWRKSPAGGEREACGQAGGS